MNTEDPSCEQGMVKAQSPSVVSNFIFKHLPRVWGRYWSARLLATGAYAVMVEDDRPKIECVRRAIRRLIAFTAFCIPFELPIKVAVMHKSPSLDDSENE